LYASIAQPGEAFFPRADASAKKHSSGRRMKTQEIERSVGNAEVAGSNGWNRHAKMRVKTRIDRKLVKIYFNQSNV